MNFRKLFHDMRPRRRMWVSSDSYEVLANFIAGCDTATGGRLLDGFQQWVISRTPGVERSNRVWETVIVARRWPEVLSSGNSIGDLPQEINETVVNDLFDLLDEFLAERGEPEDC